MKILAAHIITLGTIMIALGLIGWRLRFFWFLDTWGPVAAYGFKIGVVLLGVWLWRNGDSVAVEQEVTEEQADRSWFGVAAAVVVIMGIIIFVLSRLTA